MKVISMNKVLSCVTAIIFVISCKAAQFSENECGICEFPMDHGEIVFEHPHGGFAHKKCYDSIELALKNSYELLNEKFPCDHDFANKFLLKTHCQLIKYVQAQIGPHTILGYAQVYGLHKLKALIDTNTPSAIQLGLLEKARLIKENAQQQAAPSCQ